MSLIRWDPFALFGHLRIIPGARRHRSRSRSWHRRDSFRVRGFEMACAGRVDRRHGHACSRPGVCAVVR